jgi:hypothetical protein
MVLGGFCCLGGAGVKRRRVEACVRSGALDGDLGKRLAGQGSDWWLLSGGRCGWCGVRDGRPFGLLAVGGRSFDARVVVVVAFGPRGRW